MATDEILLFRSGAVAPSCCQPGSSTVCSCRKKRACDFWTV